MKLKLDSNISYALCLEGGGARGAYQIGAWKALREAGIKIDAVAGTAVGALNGAMIVMDQFDSMVHEWENIHVVCSCSEYNFSVSKCIFDILCHIATS